MLLPNDTKPSSSVMYIGYLVLKCINGQSRIDINDLVLLMHDEKISFSSMMLGLDWLYCLGHIHFDEGYIHVLA